MDIELADAEARRRATSALNASLALTAGAGSGKTTVLVDRVLHALRDGIEPERIVAITFTEKAAGELELRLRAALEDGSAADRAEEMFRRVGQVHTSTIHSFCQDLLVREALEAAWNPGAEIVDSVFRTDAGQSAYDTWWAQFEEEDPELSLFVRETVPDHSLRRLAQLCLDYRDLEPVTVGDASFDWSSMRAELAEATAQIEEALQECTVPDEDNLVAKNAKLLAVLRHAKTLEDREAVEFVLACDECGYSKNAGRQGDWGGKENKLAFQRAVGLVETWQQRVRTRLHAKIVTHLYRHFVPSTIASKTKSGQYDFQDLLFEAARLLAKNSAARRRLASRFDMICVDEVQDTDPIQAEVAMLLSRDPNDEGAWDGSPPRPGALFAVGDPKQSIYRFRRADVATWRALRSLVAGEGEQLSLTTNFRSVPGIVSWVNHAFRDLPDFEPQVAHRAEASCHPVVLVECGGLDPDEALLRYLHRLRDSGTQIVDRSTGELRDLRWKDVMVLLPAWTKASDLQSLLSSAGIDSVVEGGTTFFARDEARLLLAAMRSIEEPADSEATVFVLRGLFGFDNQALYDFVSAGGSWRYTVRDQPAGRIGEALEILRGLHSRRERQSWVSVLDQLLDGCWASVVWLGMTDGRTRLANVAKFYSLVREAERAAPTPGAVVRTLEELAKENQEREIRTVDFDSDAVRITTYFSAKGREAPVVLLAHSNRNVSIHDYGAAAAIQRETRSVALRVPGLDPPDWGLHEEREKAEFSEEQRRFMYVAATRARDQLVVIRNGSRDKLLDLDIATALPVDAPHGERVAVGEAHVKVFHADQLDEAATETRTFPGFPTLDDALAAGSTTVHSTVESREAQMREAVTAAKRDSVTWRSVGQLVKKSGRARKYEDGVGPEGGQVVHLTMAHLNLHEEAEALKPQLPALVDSFAAQEGVDDATREKCLAIVTNMLEHPVLERVRRAPEYWVETPFSYPAKGMIVSGIIDLCFPTDDTRRTWVVVDWKSNLPPQGTPERASYEKQLAYYAKALIAAVTPCESVETVLVGPHPELLTQTSLEDALEMVDPDLSDVLARLVADGAAVPDVGIDIGEPVVGVLELAWPELGFGVSLDATAEMIAGMEQEGWTVFDARTNHPTWTERVYDAVTEQFGLRVSNDDEEPSLEEHLSEVSEATDVVVPVEASELRDIPGVVGVRAEKRIAYTRGMSRADRLDLVARGWMVVDAPAEDS